jgi:hypothetical protein
MENLGEEDLAVFAWLQENGWVLLPEKHQYIWKNYDLGGEENGPHHNEEEIIDGARALYRYYAKTEPAPKAEVGLPTDLKDIGWTLHGEHNVWYCKHDALRVKTNVWTDAQQAIDEAVEIQQKYERDVEFNPQAVEEEASSGFSSAGEIASQIIPEETAESLSEQTQDEVIERLVSQAPTEHFSDHEVDLRKKLVEWLKAEGVEVRCDVECAGGAADVVTEEAIFEIKHALTLADFYKTSNDLLSYWRALVNSEQLDDGADAIILVCCAEDLNALKAAADTVAVMTLEEIMVPSPPEFFESLLTQANQTGSIAAFRKLIEDNQLQDVTIDRRFTPSQRTKLHEALDACNVCVYAGLSDSEETSGILTQQMDPARIKTHPSLLMRAQGLDIDHVEELEAGYRAGRTYPPADIFFDGENYWLADGNHRHAGATRAGKLLDVTVHHGTLRDAIRFALEANVEHGLKLTNDDKRLKVVTLLSDPEWFKESDTILGGIAHVTQQFISSVRRDLVPLLPALELNEGQETDETLASMLNVPVGLVRVVRRIPTDERASLTQNILSDDGRRRGADGVVRSIPSKPAQPRAEEPELFSEESDAANEFVEETSAQAAEAAPAESSDEIVEAQRPGASDAAADSVSSSPEATEHGTALAKPSDGARAESTTSGGGEALTEQLSPSYRLASLLKKCPEGMTTEEVLAQGFTMHDINQARTAREIERHENGRCFYVWKPADVVSALEEYGMLSRLELEDLGCQSYVINATLSEGLISQPETGKFTLPKEASGDRPVERAASESRQETRPEAPAEKHPAQQAPSSSAQVQSAPRQAPPVGLAIEKGLKNRKMIIGFTFIAGLKGKVQATVNVADNVQGAGREVIPLEELVLPDRVLKMIDYQLGTNIFNKADTTAAEKAEPKPKVERILEGLKGAKDLEALNRLAEHYHIGSSNFYSRFDAKDAKRITDALAAQKKKFSPASKKRVSTKKSATKKPSARATKVSAKKSSTKGSKKGARSSTRARA